jgi:phosphoribosylformimino-5-aminoimidazole carboxamide ribotide isomerase
MTFTLWPAIDLKQGKCVRLVQGDMAQSTTYADSPAAQAWRFRDVGFRHLHVVDLDGAFAGAPANAEAVEAILYETDAKVQLGGGIRDLDTVERWLGLGITRVILGTAAVTDPDFVKAALKAFPGRIVLGLDAKDGRVATEGWGRTSSLTAAEVVARYDAERIAAIVYTDISRDGIMAGVNLEATRALANECGIEVLASGGVASVDDLHELSLYQTEGVAGAVLGRALYEGVIDPEAALGLETQ